jgi:hypothetical protein
VAVRAAVCSGLNQGHLCLAPTPFRGDLGFSELDEDRIAVAQGSGPGFEHGDFFADIFVSFPDGLQLGGDRLASLRRDLEPLGFEDQWLQRASLAHDDLMPALVVFTHQALKFRLQLPNPHDKAGLLLAQRFGLLRLCFELAELSGGG